MTSEALYTAVAFAGLALSACSFDTSARAAARDDGGISSDSGTSGNIDAAPNQASGLAITEVKTTTSGLQFIEVYNIGCEPVELGNYYLTDSSEYPRMPEWGEIPPELSEYDAVVGFPDGAVIAAGEAIVVARYDVDFNAAFGFPPDYALLPPELSSQMNIVAAGWRNDFFIRNSGEAIALFAWDGLGDLVEDADMVIAGEAPRDDESLVPKPIAAPDGVDGPDADELPTLYFDDAATLPPMASRDHSQNTDAANGSYQRILFEDGHELTSGGNGIDGHDETSENTRVTWEQEIDTVPTPGEVPESLQVDCGSVGPGR